MSPISFPARPCNTCPYRTDTPAGIWAPEEYAKLVRYDSDEVLPPFLCHQTTSTGKETGCRGWLTVHADSVAVRVALVRGQVTVEDRDAGTDVRLYPSGAEAAVAGLRAVLRPGSNAVQAIDRLVAKGIGR
jgi:hypothetical protein